MKQPLIFATGNFNKVKEVRQMLDESMEIISMREIGVTEEIPETSDTIQGNALQKARYLADKYKVNCFSEDTGLEVDVLDGAPGVYTARYGGESRDADDNMDRLLMELMGKMNRAAQFRTVIALILDGKEYTFEGICRGSILRSRRGNGGFGYDPVFQPLGYGESFAELSPTIKNSISHRGLAMRQLIAFLQKENKEELSSK